MMIMMMIMMMVVADRNNIDGVGDVTKISIANKTSDHFTALFRRTYFDGRLLEPIKSQLPVAYWCRFRGPSIFKKKKKKKEKRKKREKRGPTLLYPVNLSEIGFRSKNRSEEIDVIFCEKYARSMPVERE